MVRAIICRVPLPASSRWWLNHLGFLEEAEKGHPLAAAEGEGCRWWPRCKAAHIASCAGQTVPRVALPKFLQLRMSQSFHFAVAITGLGLVLVVW